MVVWFVESENTTSYCWDIMKWGKGEQGLEFRQIQCILVSILYQLNRMKEKARAKTTNFG